MDYHKTTIALIAWLVWGGDKKTADEIGRDEYFSVGILQEFRYCRGRVNIFFCNFGLKYKRLRPTNIQV